MFFFTAQWEVDYKNEIYLQPDAQQYQVDCLFLTELKETVVEKHKFQAVGWWLQI